MTDTKTCAHSRFLRWSPPECGSIHEATIECLDCWTVMAASETLPLGHPAHPHTVR